MAAKLLTHFKKRITSLNLVPDGGGCFEISVNGKPIYSKLATGEFPAEQMIVSKIEEAGQGTNKT